jgi:hypothetical protein
MAGDYYIIIFRCVVPETGNESLRDLQTDEQIGIHRNRTRRNRAMMLRIAHLVNRRFITERVLENSSLD